MVAIHGAGGLSERHGVGAPPRAENRYHPRPTGKVLLFPEPCTTLIKIDPTGNLGLGAISGVSVSSGRISTFIQSSHLHSGVLNRM